MLFLLLYWYFCSSVVYVYYFRWNGMLGTHCRRQYTPYFMFITLQTSTQTWYSTHSKDKHYAISKGLPQLSFDLRSSLCWNAATWHGANCRRVKFTKSAWSILKLQTTFTDWYLDWGLARREMWNLATGRNPRWVCCPHARRGVSVVTELLAATRGQISSCWQDTATKSKRAPYPPGPRPKWAITVIIRVV